MAVPLAYSKLEHLEDLLGCAVCVSKVIILLKHPSVSLVWEVHVHKVLNGILSICFEQCFTFSPWVFWCRSKAPCWFWQQKTDPRFESDSSYFTLRIFFTWLWCWFPSWGAELKSSRPITVEYLCRNVKRLFTTFVNGCSAAYVKCCFPLVGFTSLQLFNNSVCLRLLCSNIKCLQWIQTNEWELV